MTTIEQFVGLHAQMHEIIKRVGNGSLPATLVRRSLQDIIEGHFPSVEKIGKVALSTTVWNPPSWWRTPEQQLERARQLWPDAVLPKPPKEFVPASRTEVLLLHVPRPFKNLWDKVDAPFGLRKKLSDFVKSDKRSLRLAPSVVVRTEPVWLAFDPEANKGMRPDSLWGQPNLAASEVLSALIQFPDWPLMWCNGASAPTLGGFQLKFGGSWSHVLYLQRNDVYSILKLYTEGADVLQHPNWALPVVREV